MSPLTTSLPLFGTPFEPLSLVWWIEGGWISRLFFRYLLDRTAKLLDDPSKRHDIRYWSIHFNLQVYTLRISLYKLHGRRLRRPRVRYRPRTKFRRYRTTSGSVASSPDPWWSWDRPPEAPPPYQENINSREISKGVTPSQIQRLLRQLPPLQWYRHQLGLGVDLFGIQSHMDSMQNAYVATADILRETHIKLKTGPDELSGAYLSDHEVRQDIPVIFDTGCSCSLTPIMDDFVSKLDTTDVEEMRGLADAVSIEGIGWVEWPIRDVFGRIHTVRTQAYYVPKATIRLFSPQEYFKENQGGEAKIDSLSLTFTTSDGNELMFPYHPASNLPVMYVDENVHTMGVTAQQAQAFAQLAEDKEAAKQILDSSNYNLSKPQKELLLWHSRLAHAGLSWIISLMTSKQKLEYGIPANRPLIPIKTSIKQHARDGLACAACKLSKMHTRSPDVNTTIAHPDKEMVIKREHLHPGDCISMDQYVCRQQGRLATSYGKENTSKKYNGGTIFVDHATGYIYVHNQVSLRTGETLQGKHELEQFAAQHGVRIKTYRADNHPFGSKEFLEDIKLQDQEIDFSGVGAHHQNGVAERGVMTVTTWARAMMMHQLIHWPNEFSPDLWPFALEHAAYLWNNLPKDKSRLSPRELFTGEADVDKLAILRSRVWGCPVFVLDPKLQDGHKLPKWTMRSRQGMYLGSSPKHSSTVGRILNLATGAVTPQYHVVYDELFTTVPASIHDSVFDKELWNGLLHLDGLEQNLDPTDIQGDEVPFQEWYDDFVESNNSDDSSGSSVPEGGDPNTDNEDTSDPSNPPTSVTLEEYWEVDRILDHRVQRNGTIKVEVHWNTGETTWEPLKTIGEDTPETCAEYALERGLLETEPWNKFKGKINKPTLLPEGVPGSEGDKPLRRSTRRRNQVLPQEAATYASYQHYKKPSKLKGYKRDQYLAGGVDNKKTHASQRQSAFIHGLTWDSLLTELKSGDSKRGLLATLKSIDREHNTIEDWDPLALAARANDPDTPRWHEAMNGPDADAFWEACRTEIATLEKMNVWEVVPQEPWMKVVKSTWAFKVKRFPSGEVRKVKSRFCVRGDTETHGVDCHETYAPVISWTTVRLLLILSIQMGLATQQIDYTAAFVHADIERHPDFDKMTKEEQRKTGSYIECPQGFVPPNFKDGSRPVLKLRKSLYGRRSAPRNFFTMLKSNLEKIGFKQMVDVDPCLFISDRCICLVYVDDTLFFAPTDADINEAVKKLEEIGMELTIENDVAGFLGVHIKRDEKRGEITLTQRGLIDKIIEALQIKDLPAVATPADKVIGKDEDGDPAHCTFNYASVIGMLYYVTGHSRPDLKFAVSQAARFAFQPKRSHELALIRIGQYLKGTRDKGLMFKPSSPTQFKMDAYVDSDFMGLYAKEQRDDPCNVKSRTGYVICINDSPIIWQSKLQESIALSTMMAEYYALSTAMREVLPLRELVSTVAKGCNIDPKCLTTFKTTAWEDNMGALTLANLDPGHQTPRSKFYDVKVHWFRSHLKPNNVEIKKIDTTVQVADLFTKPLVREVFERLRVLLMGW